MSAMRRHFVASGPVFYLSTDGGSKVFMTVPFNPATAALWVIKARGIGLIGPTSTPTMGAVETWCLVRYNGTTKGIPSTSPSNGSTTLRTIWNGSGGMTLNVTYASNTITFSGGAAASGTIWLHVELLEWEL